MSFRPRQVAALQALPAWVLLLRLVALPLGGQPVAQGTIRMPDSASDQEKTPRPVDPCADTVSPAPAGLVVWSPNGKQYILNKPDDAGVYQLYVGTRGSSPICISCAARPNAPAPDRNKLQPRWHPSGKWIVLAVEMDNFQAPAFASPQMIQGWLQSGIWVNIFMTRPDGSEWYQLSNFGQGQADGFTGVAFTPNGKLAAWAQIVDGNIFQYLFGRWQLILADFDDSDGIPKFSNLRDITPQGAAWIEPGNFAPDGRSLLITSDIGLKDPQGMDQFIVDVTTGAVQNLTNSPNVWDEHGIFSPDGTKILFMSSYPYRSNPLSSTLLFLKTEFMLMDSDGSNLRQLTHFNVPGYPESDPPQQSTVAAIGGWNPDGRSITALNLVFPSYQTWSIIFFGRCGSAEGYRQTPFQRR